MANKFVVWFFVIVLSSITSAIIIGQLQQFPPTGGSVKVYDSWTGNNEGQLWSPSFVHQFNPNANSDVTGISILAKVPSENWVEDSPTLHLMYINVGILVKCPWALQTKIVANTVMIIGFPENVWLEIALTSGMINTDNPDFVANESCGWAVHGDPDVVGIITRYDGIRSGNTLRMVVWAEIVEEAEEEAELPPPAETGGIVGGTAVADDDVGEPAAPTVPRSTPGPELIAVVAIIIIVVAVGRKLRG